MKFVVALIALGLTASASATTRTISMVGSNAIDKDLPMNVLAGKEFRSRPGMKFVKLHFFTDQPLEKLASIDIEMCAFEAGKPLTAANAWLQGPVEFFFNFDEGVVQSDGPRSTTLMGMQGSGVFDPHAKVVLDRKRIPEKIHSVTMNFGRNKDICVRKVTFREWVDKNSNAADIETPPSRVLAGGKVTASSVLAPEMAYSPMNLFDSRFENGWATKGVSKGAKLSFEFPVETTVTKLRIWNGYQRSKAHCQANARPKTIAVLQDGKEIGRVKLEDKMLSQDLALPTAFKGKNLTLETVDAFRGGKYADLVIAEMRFFDGKDWIMFDPMPELHAVNDFVRGKFAEAGLTSILDGEIKRMAIYEDKEGKKNAVEAEYGDDGGTLRLRSDGTFFYNGYYMLDGGDGEVVNALGTFEVTKAAKDDLQLRLFGTMSKATEVNDCNGCGYSCNSPEKAENSNEKKIFQDTVKISPTKVDGVLSANLYSVTSVSKSSKLKLKKETVWSE